MSTSLTPHKKLYQVTVATELDTWGPFVNANTAMYDTALGGVATVALTSSVTLSSAQYQCNFLNFTGALTANITVTLPPLGSIYTAQNLTSNTSNFNVTLSTSVSSGTHIALPWGEATDIFCDGASVKFRNLERAGTLLDIATATVPSWITACSNPPYLLCDGSTFSATTYPALAALIGQTDPGTGTNYYLPDLRGRTRFAIDPVYGSVNIFASQFFTTFIGNQNLSLDTDSYMPWTRGPEFNNTALTGGSGRYAMDASGSLSNVNAIPPAIVTGITLIRAV